MDHWGDPWADNANDKSPTKNAVKSPLPPAFAFAPVPLSGFVDDAGWGNNSDDGFGDWATSDPGHVASTDVVSTAAEDTDPGSAGWAAVTHEERDDIGVGWQEPVSSAPQNLEKVDSEPSDSSTVSQLDEAVSQDAVEEPTQQQADVESSVRSSTSPSETSRNDLPLESPRTSIEDERIIGNDLPQSEPLVLTAITAGSHKTVTEAGPENTIQESEPNTNRSTGVDCVEEKAAGTGDADHPTSSLSDDQSPSPIIRSLDETLDDPTTVDIVQPQALLTSFVCDKALLAQLFPSSETSGKELDTHDDPIFSTSARKAWYRLTRKQTMREFNHGDNDDNYIRVTWTNSHVRGEVHKVVSRWAREDRLSGTGPGARASFYWDTPAPSELKEPFGHSRTHSSVPTTKTALPTRQSLPPLSSSQSAAFNWSSSVSADPWKLESPTQRSTSTPLAPKNPVVAKLQRQEGRAVSVDLKSRKSEQTMHRRTATVSHIAPETTNVANLTSSLVTQPSAEVSGPWTDLDHFDSPPTPAAESDVPVDDDDDDDDWGEMVQTPTLPTQQQLDPFSQPSEPKVTSPSPSSPTSNQPVATGVPGVPVETMSAAPIVRLQSTISPTSALFKANNFVPLNAEQGPIGPGILKPANRSVRSTSDKILKIDVSGEANMDVSNVATVSHKDDEGGKNGEAASRTKPKSLSSPVEPELVECTQAKASSPIPTSQIGTPAQASADSWADADFSFFESTLPTTASQPSSQTLDPSDPFSFFDTPIPTSTTLSSKSFSRSPPRTSTPPTLQPLTSATSSLHRRKAEEDHIISDILSGLPDLSYMLRQ